MPEFTEETEPRGGRQLVSPRDRKRENPGPCRGHSASQASSPLGVEWRKREISSIPQLQRPSGCPHSAGHPMKPRGSASPGLTCAGDGKAHRLRGVWFTPGQLQLACSGPTVHASPSLYEATADTSCLVRHHLPWKEERTTPPPWPCPPCTCAWGCQTAQLPCHSQATMGLAAFAQAGPWLGYPPCPHPSPGKRLLIVHSSAQRSPSPGSLP